MQDVERNSMPMKANSVNTAHFSAITEVLRMNTNGISAYGMGMSNMYSRFEQKFSGIIQSLGTDIHPLGIGIISEHEFRKCELKIAEKFDISLCSIYRETA